MFLDARRIDQRCWTAWQHVFPELNLLLDPVDPAYLNSDTFLKDLIAAFYIMILFYILSLFV
jgi:hypothetical protein